MAMTTFTILPPKYSLFPCIVTVAIHVFTLFVQTFPGTSLDAGSGGSVELSAGDGYGSKKGLGVGNGGMVVARLY